MKSSVIVFPGSNCDRDIAVALKKMNFNNTMVWHKDTNLPKSDLMEKILSEYIGKKVMTLEIEKLGISVSDNSLRNIFHFDKKDVVIISITAVQRHL